jgi:hypothetical protein
MPDNDCARTAAPAIAAITTTAIAIGRTIICHSPQRTIILRKDIIRNMNSTFHILNLLALSYINVAPKFWREEVRHRNAHKTWGIKPAS